MDLKTYLNRPSEHLQKYPVLLEAVFHETVVGNPDADFLLQAIEAMKGLQTAAQLRRYEELYQSPHPSTTSIRASSQKHS